MLVSAETKPISPSEMRPSARAIMTTDTFPKGAMAEIEGVGGPIRIVGIAKGSGMIAPDMATMLVYLATDAAVAPKALQAMKAELGKFLRDASKTLELKKKVVATFVKEATAADKQYLAADKKMVAEINGLLAAMKTDIASFVKQYMDIVRKTDGLTSVRPGAAKALDRYALTLDEKHLSEAQATLKKHRDEVLKQAPKGDKAAVAFGKAVDELIKTLS